MKHAAIVVSIIVLSGLSIFGLSPGQNSNQENSGNGSELFSSGDENIKKTDAASNSSVYDDTNDQITAISPPVDYHRYANNTLISKAEIKSEKNIYKVVRSADAIQVDESDEETASYKEGTTTPHEHAITDLVEDPDAMNIAENKTGIRVINTDIRGSEVTTTYGQMQGSTSSFELADSPYLEGSSENNIQNDQLDAEYLASNQAGTSDQDSAGSENNLPPGTAYDEFGNVVDAPQEKKLECPDTLYGGGNAYAVNMLKARGCPKPEFYNGPW